LRVISFIFAVWLATLINFAPRSETAQQTDHTDNAAYNFHIGPFFPILPSHDQANNPKDGSKNQSPPWYETSEGILVIITGITAFFICLQALYTRRAAEGTRESVIEIRKQVGLMEIQTEATKKAADAARDSVEAVINKERARIRINLKELSLMPRQDSIYCVDFIVTIVVLPTNLDSQGLVF